MSLSNVIKSIQDVMRQDTGVDGDAQRISQMVWMLFLKIFDDHEEELEILDDKYKSPIPKKLRWRDWAKNEEGITGDMLVKFINDDLFEGLKNLSTTGKFGDRARLVKEVFEDSYNYMKSGSLIRQVINKINEMDFTKSSDRHLFNDIYEKILRDLQNAGNAGEYYTPRAVTQFMTEMVAPKLGEKVLDPACGTGGFLVNAIEYIKSHGGEDSIENRELLQKTVIGYEKKPLPHSLAITNLLFFTKGEKTKDVWYFEHPYPEGVKSYSKTRPISIHEFDLEKEWWSNREGKTKGTKKNSKTEMKDFSQYAWKVSIEEIKERNYNLDFKNPNSKKKEEVLDRKQILEKMYSNQNEIAKLLKELAV